MINAKALADNRSYRVDFNRYRKLAPEHQPKIDLSQSIQRPIEGLDRHQTYYGTIDTSRYVRLRALNGLREANLIDPNLKWCQAFSEVTALQD